MTDDEPDWRNWTPIMHYGKCFGLIVTFNARMFWAWDRRDRHLHLCAGPLEVSVWRK